MEIGVLLRPQNVISHPPDFCLPTDTMGALRRNTWKTNFIVYLLATCSLALTLGTSPVAKIPDLSLWMLERPGSRMLHGSTSPQLAPEGCREQDSFSLLPIYIQLVVV